MTKVRVTVATLIAALALAVSGGPASAWLSLGESTKYPIEGGVWKYGFWNAKVHSHYYHSTKCHGSTAQFWNGSSWSTNRDQTNAGYWSDAHVGAYNLWYTDDRYYYRPYCT
jgi:hypothetical protein